MPLQPKGIIERMRFIAAYSAGQDEFVASGVVASLPRTGATDPAPLVLG
jgi:hypothetical protein